jgi:hypothetical protein
MKKLILILLLFSYSIKNTSLYAQKNDAAAGIAGAVVGGIAAGLLVAASIENVKEGMERNIVEWIYSKYNMEEPLEFELKLIKWEAAKKEDLSNVSVVGYKFYDNNNPPRILLNACSPGWINDAGINFEFVKVYEINQEYWSKILLTYLNLVRKSSTPKITDIEKIPVVDKKGGSALIPLYFMKSVSTTQIIFSNTENQEFKFDLRPLDNGDIHIGSNFDNEFKIDYNEGNLNLFLKSTRDLVRIKRDFIVDITKNVFSNKIPVTVYGK